jgi:hypothetical protein
MAPMNTDGKIDRATIILALFKFRKYTVGVTTWIRTIMAGFRCAQQMAVTWRARRAREMMICG